MHVRRVLLPLLAPVVLAVGCSSGGDDGPAVPPGISEQSFGALDLQLVGADVVSPHRAMSPLDPGTAGAALEAVQRAFDATVVAPLRDGEIGALDESFTADAAERAGGVDAAAVLDGGLGEPGPIKLEKGDVLLTALAGDGDRPEVVVARIDWDVRSPERELQVRRAGELTLVPGFGRWFVGAYTVLTSRTIGGETTSTTAASG